MVGVSRYKRNAAGCAAIPGVTLGNEESGQKIAATSVGRVASPAQGTGCETKTLSPLGRECKLVSDRAVL
jgi:hypothetical protein